MTLSKEQGEEKVKYVRWLWIWGRDLLELAHRHQAWYIKALELGFSMEKIWTQWPHTDEGRHIAYRRIG